MRHAEQHVFRVVVPKTQVSDVSGPKKPLSMTKSAMIGALVAQVWALSFEGDRDRLKC